MIDSFEGKYRFLSNFSPSEVYFEGMRYPTVEHAYQAAKSTNPIVRLSIQQARTPAEAKKLGQQITLRPDWEDIKYEVMKELLFKKFTIEHLQLALIATEPHELVEGNWWGDTYWGVCKGVGENNLGKLLMLTRSILIQSYSTKE